MKSKRCCFAGHSDFRDERAEEELYTSAEKLIKERGVNVFWVGNYGLFDKKVRNVLVRLKEKYNIKIELIIPYLTKEINENKKYKVSIAFAWRRCLKKRHTGSE